MLELIENLCHRLNDSGVSYTHWKSTTYISDVLSGSDDLDLLIAPPDRHHFEAILAELGFVAVHHAGAKYAPLAHYLGLDPATKQIVHLHAYFRVITGGTILKSHRLPLEKLFLKNNRFVEGVMPVPPSAADLAGFCVRRMLALISPLEYGMLRREGLRELYAEYDKLSGNGDQAIEGQAIDILCEELPNLSRSTARGCFDCIKYRKSYLRCWVTAAKLHMQLKQYCLHSPPLMPFIRSGLFLKKVIRRMSGGRLKFRIRNGGLMIAVVGGDASGKSTLCASLHEVLSGHLKVRQSHAGIPPATLLTAVPRALLPIARALAPSATSTRIETEMYSQGAVTTEIRGFRRYVFALRSVMLAYERFKLLTRLFRQSSRDGHIIIIDRFSCRVPGAPDSPQINSERMHIPEGSFLEKMRLLEEKLYNALPPADLIIKLELKEETAVERNRTRIKKGNESAQYVVRRHRLLKLQDFSHCPHVVTLDAEKTQDVVLSEAISAVWRHL